MSSKIIIPDLLNSVDYSPNPAYVPSRFALEFVNFIKLVNGAEGEENKTPVLHYRILDQIGGNENRIANMLFRGAAKALELSTPVLTPDGYRPIEDIHTGDIVFDRDGKETEVIYESEIFENQSYKITLTNGSSFVCNEDHLHIVQRRTQDKERNNYWQEEVLSTKELLEKGVVYPRQITDRCPKGYEHKWYIPLINDKVQFESKEFPIDAYTTGIILGDGNVDTKTGLPRITGVGEDLKEILSHIPYEYSLHQRKNNLSDKVYYANIFDIAPLCKKYIGTHKHKYKRIPEDLLFGSVKERIAVLQGLMDTDGTISDKGNYTFTTVSLYMAKGMVHLVKSLGGFARYKHYKNKHEGYYTVSFNLLDINPFRLKRKADKWVANKHFKSGQRIGIDSIEPVEAKTKCIGVASKTKSFLIEDCIVTHNSTIFGEYLFLYLATFGGMLPNFGRIELALYVSDSIDNGVKNMRKNIEYRWGNSDFLQSYVPEAKFTDIEWKFKNKDNEIFIVKGYGAKALSLDTTLYTPKGKTTIGECRVGDVIYGADGKPTKITAKSNFFTNDMYRLHYDDGRTLDVNEDHINPVLLYGNGFRKHEQANLTTKELLSISLQRRPRWYKLNNVRTPAIKAIDYPVADLPCDPYLYGLLLAAGIGSGRSALYLRVHSKANHELIKKKISQYIHKEDSGEEGTAWQNRKNYHIDRNIRFPRTLSVHSKTANKSIHKKYFRASISQRLELLRGLMDLHGKVVERGYLCLLRCRSAQLAEDIAELVRSLGGWATTEKKTNHRGDRLYSCRFTLNYAAFSDPKDIAKQKIYERHPAIEYIQKIPNVKSQCIAVDNQERQFIAGDYLRTHNTGIRGTKAMGKRPKLAILDDLISDEDARSATEMANIKDTIYKAIDYALHPTMQKIIWCGTPFNAKDPLYEAVESGAWAVNVYPVCEKFPCEPKEFRGAWEDRFTYEYVKGKYEKAIKEGMISSFNQELMLRIMSDDERLLEENCFRWYDKNALMKNKSDFNWYITTDFATTEKQSGDYSVISVWALNSNNDWFWVDGICAKQTMDKNIDDLFRLVSKYYPVNEVGIEVTGQQQGFIPWIQKEMMNRNIWFTLASKGNDNAPGIRPNTNKMQRFNVVVPWFKAGKMHFPVGHEFNAALQEMLEELRLASGAGFKSKHDDAIDTISMLASLKTFAPTVEASLTRNAGDVYEEVQIEEDYSSSYFV